MSSSEGRFYAPYENVFGHETPQQHTDEVRYYKADENMREADPAPTRFQGFTPAVLQPLVPEVEVHDVSTTISNSSDMKQQQRAFRIKFNKDYDSIPLEEPVERLSYAVIEGGPENVYRKLVQFGGSNAPHIDRILGFSNYVKNVTLKTLSNLEYLNEKIAAHKKYEEHTLPEYLKRLENLSEAAKGSLPPSEAKKLMDDRSKLIVTIDNKTAEKIQLQKDFDAHKIALDKLQKEYDSILQAHEDLKKTFDEKLDKESSAKFEQLQQAIEKTEQERNDLISKTSDAKQSQQLADEARVAHEEQIEELNKERDQLKKEKTDFFDTKSKLVIEEIRESKGKEFEEQMKKDREELQKSRIELNDKEKQLTETASELGLKKAKIDAEVVDMKKHALALRVLDDNFLKTAFAESPELTKEQERIRRSQVDNYMETNLPQLKSVIMKTYDNYQSMRRSPWWVKLLGAALGITTVSLSTLKVIDVIRYAISLFTNDSKGKAKQKAVEKVIDDFTKANPKVGEKRKRNDDK
jgi:DNA repair exonuclease SbcCD ATPase subunit